MRYLRLMVHRMSLALAQHTVSVQYIATRFCRRMKQIHACYDTSFMEVPSAPLTVFPGNAYKSPVPPRT